MSTNIADIVCLIRPLSGDNDPEVRKYSDSDIRAFIAVVSPMMPFTVTIIDRLTIEEDLTPAEVSRLSLECALLMVSQQLEEFTYKTPVLAVKRKRGKLDSSLQVIWDLIGKLDDPAVSWDDEINKILEDYDRYMDALAGGSDG